MLVPARPVRASLLCLPVSGPVCAHTPLVLCGTTGRSAGGGPAWGCAHVGIRMGWLCLCEWPCARVTVLCVPGVWGWLARNVTGGALSVHCICVWLCVYVQLCVLWFMFMCSHVVVSTGEAVGLQLCVHEYSYVCVDMFVTVCPCVQLCACPSPASPWTYSNKPIASSRGKQEVPHPLNTIQPASHTPDYSLCSWGCPHVALNGVWCLTPNNPAVTNKLLLISSVYFQGSLLNPGAGIPPSSTDGEEVIKTAFSNFFNVHTF